jgi:alginate O-acetyltransferase complex protein AlgI
VWSTRRDQRAEPSKLGLAVFLEFDLPCGFFQGCLVFFNSPTFLACFLPAVLLGYYAVPVLLRRGTLAGRVMNLFLFFASVCFYAWGEKAYVLVLLGSWAFNHRLALFIDHRRSRGLLLAGIAANLGLLGYFKYTSFALRTLGVESTTATHLPIGVSFFTFQAISYLIDVYRRTVPADPHPVRFGLYVFLFPHLIAGPIVRYADIAQQLTAREHSLELFASGARRLILGLAKKVLLADTLAPAVDTAFSLPAGSLSCGAAWFAVGCYALQIYFDFSGYSDMAIGLGRMFGFTFHENFRHPYTATSITDFWRRWHISLSSWFRDYVYIPLGGNRASAGATYRNLLVVFLLCGLWHGANFTFVLWGLWHGLFLILERAGLGRILIAMPDPLRRIYTLAAVVAGWVLFRAEDVGKAGSVYESMLGLNDGSFITADFATNPILLAFHVGALCCLPGAEYVSRRWPGWAELLAVPLLAVLLLLAAAGMAGNTYSSFIYFRF